MILMIASEEEWTNVKELSGVMEVFFILLEVYF